ncbi:MAG: L-aspartate oxidase [Phycisphaerae bacterium]|nr:L-aspartate oxidase [Phycisphaerae bacterium]
MPNSYLQRRYLVSFATRRLPHIFTDVLIVGGGAAGLRAAIEAAQYGQVILLTKDRPKESNTLYAQGGLAAVIAKDDSIEDHIADTLRTGVGLCDDGAVRECISSAPRQIAELRAWGMEFDCDDGELHLGREGGHGAHRVVHSHGDATGRALEEFLFARAQATDNLKIFDECFSLDLLTDPPEGGRDARCVGALTDHPRFGMQVIHARRTILAAGGAGVLWRETTNPTGATADGVAMAFRAGAALADLEMMQFHPTTLYVAGSTRSLISEAVRGEGAHLLDRDGVRFMAEYDDMGELAPRDVVSRAILDRMVKTGTNKVFLDVRHMGAEAFAARFPFIDQQCRSFDIHPGKDLIPVHPAAHYMVGGVRVDLQTRTSLPGLLACGEAACTGLHGANRLASNSLSEALVFGRRAGRTAGEALANENNNSTGQAEWTIEPSERTELDLTDIRNSLRSMMWRNVGIVRDGQRLSESLEIIEFWGRYVMDKEFYSESWQHRPVDVLGGTAGAGRRGWEVQNMLTVAYLATELALRRTETRGVHYRQDFPNTDPHWTRHQVVRRTEHQLVVE